MFIFDEKIPIRLNFIKDKDDALDFIEFLNELYCDPDLDCCKECLKVINCDSSITLNLAFPENRKFLKAAEDIIKYAIDNENYEIIRIVDLNLHSLINDINSDYLFESEYITWCTFTYEEILLSNDIYREKHKGRYIDPRIYEGKSLEWIHERFEIFKHIPPEKITITDEMISNLDYYFYINIYSVDSAHPYDWSFVKFVYAANPKIISRVADQLKIDVEDAVKLMNSY